jgi:polyhydroxyalkanoate synthesis regulator phasin
MDMNAKRKVVIGVAAGLLLVGAGGAFAAGKLTSPKEERQAVINDAANRLGIEPAKLSDALTKALEDRVDAAVADGRITKAEGEALKARIEAGDAPLLFGAGGPHRGGPGFGHHHGPGLDAAAKYLGVTEAQLRTELQNGKTLAEVAKAHGKTVGGLVNALVDEAKTHLDAAVKAGRLTQAEANEMLSDLKDHITDFVNGRFPAPPFGDHHGDRHGFRGGAFFGPPPAGRPA